MEIGMEMMIWMTTTPGRFCMICLLLWYTALHLLCYEYGWELDGILDWHWMNTKWLALVLRITHGRRWAGLWCFAWLSGYDQVCKLYYVSVTCV